MNFVPKVIPINELKNTGNISRIWINISINMDHKTF